MAETVRVAVRCRPMSARETSMGSKSIVAIEDGRAVAVTNPKEPTDVKRWSFNFAYGDGSTQVQVFEDLGKPMVLRAIDGFNGTIFAYGQTGSGKTHTMMGTGDDIGIIPKLNAMLFEQVQEKTNNETKFLVTVSYLEIYNEKIHDLLNPTERDMNIREHPDLGVYVEGLCEVVVRNEGELLKLIEQGNTVRKVAATLMNERSSRSHSCFIIKIEQKTTTTNEATTRETALSAKLNLVDLAGSERVDKTQASGQTAKEGMAINVSLMYLGRVITALGTATKNTNKTVYIPYRESKLTRLLQESLGGNSMTTMMAAISPAAYNVDETISTLRYAAQASTISNKVVRNEDVNEKMIRELKTEIEKLRQQLVVGGGGTLSPTAGTQQDEGLKTRLEELEKLQESSWEEKEKLSKMLEMERANNMSSVISSVVDNVKVQKLEMMKTIKRLQNAKAQMTKIQQDKREAYQLTKAKLDADMRKYQELQEEFESDPDDDRKDAIEDAMTQLLGNIERDRDSMGQFARELNRLKSDLKKTDEELNERRAELMAHVGILEENDRLRQAVIAEEKAKWEAEKENFLSKELEGERLKLNEAKDEILKEADRYKQELERAQAGERLLQARTEQLEKERNDLEEANKELEAKVTLLEGKMAESEVDLEAAYEESSRLKKEVESQKAEAEQAKDKLKRVMEDMELTRQGHELEMRRLRELGGGGKNADGAGQVGKGSAKDDSEYEMFRDLMNMFNEERSKMETKYRETTALLRKALEDIIYLSGQNEQLHRQLQHAESWEPTLW